MNIGDQKWTFGIANETSDLVETGTQKRETKAKRDLKRNFVDDVEEHHCWLKTSRTDETKRWTTTNRRETSLETSKIQRSGHWVSRTLGRCSRGLWCYVLVMSSLETGECALQKAIVWGLSRVIYQFQELMPYMVPTSKWSYVQQHSKEISFSLM